MATTYSKQRVLKGGLLSLAAAAAGTVAVTAGEDGHIRLWDASEGVQIQLLQLERPLAPPVKVNSVSSCSRFWSCKRQWSASSLKTLDQLYVLQVPLAAPEFHALQAKHEWSPTCIRELVIQVMPALTDQLSSVMLIDSQYRNHKFFTPAVKDCMYEHMHVHSTFRTCRLRLMIWAPQLPSPPAATTVVQVSLGCWTVTVVSC